MQPAKFCLWCGTPLRTRSIEGKELHGCPSCDFVLWPDPKLATAVVVESGGGLVAGRRAIEPGRGLWCLPGGFVDDDEHPEAGAVRECREEIGVEVHIEGLVGVYHVRRSQRPHLVVLGYRGRISEGQPVAGHEMDEVGVFAPEQLPPLAFSSHREVVRDFLNPRADRGAHPPAGADGGEGRARRRGPGEPRR